MDTLFSPQGRLGRLAYLGHYLAVSLAAMAAILLVGLLGGLLGAFWILAVPVYLAVLVYTVIISIRRLHDLDKSGWYLLLFIIPIVGFVFAFYMICAKGNPVANQYGQPPVTQNWERNMGWAGVVLSIVSVLAITIALVVYGPQLKAIIQASQPAPTLDMSDADYATLPDAEQTVIDPNLNMVTPESETPSTDSTSYN